MNSNPAAAENTPLDHAGVRTIVIGIMLAMFLGALDQTIVATALPTIGRDLADVDNLSWVVTAYLVATTTATPLYGKLSDIHGRRAMLLIAISIFAAGSLACALAPTMLALVLARALQGLGGGGLMSLAQTIIADAVTPLERGRYQGYIGVVFATSSIGGPVLGGFLADHLHWSLIFWINLPLGLVAFLMTNRALKRLPRRERPHRLDFAGAVLMAAATVVLLLTLAWGGTRYPWNSRIIVMLLGGASLLSILFVLRLMTAREPFLPLSVLLNPVVGIGTASVTCVYGTMIGLTIFVPLYFEVVLGLTASQSGLALIPLIAAVVVGSTAVGRALVHLRRYKRMPIGGLAVAIAGLAVMVAKPAGLPLPLVCIFLGLVGFGLGTLFPVTTVAIQNAVMPHQLGTATGAMNFFRSLGGALLVAGFSAIVMSGTGDGHAGLTLEALAADTARFGSHLADAFRWVFAAAAACIAVGLLCLLIMEERPLRGRPAGLAERAVAAE